MRYVKLLIVLICIATLASCVEEKEMAQKTFGDDLAFLKKYTDVVVLSETSGNSQVAVLPALQGRAMTSTAEGTEGLSFGWINRELIASGRRSSTSMFMGVKTVSGLGLRVDNFRYFSKKVCRSTSSIGLPRHPLIQNHLSLFPNLKAVQF